MKLVTFENDGTPGWGVISGADGIVSGRELLGGRFGRLKDVLARERLDELRDEVSRRAPDIGLDAVRLLPPVPDPAHVYCAGLNYLAHAQEVQKDKPDAPRFFLRTASSLIGHGAPVERPKVSTDLDFEGEVAVVLGKGGRHIPVGQAMAYVAGYTCFMDGSVRDYQKHTTTSGKNFHATGAVGPWIVTADEIPDWQALTLETRLNGEIVQKTGTDSMIVSIPEMIAYLSDISVLQPGDIIVTGTPEGIGCRREPPLWLKPGDRIEVSVSGVGTLSNPVADER